MIIMELRSGKTLVTLAAVMILLSFLVTSVPVAFSQNSGPYFDIYTQQQPHSGKGLNVSSDAYGPDDVVIIYALALYNDYPAAGIQVAFQIDGPPNPVQNVTIFAAVETNSSGIAMISFRIGTDSVVNYGEWTIIGNARIVDSLVQDVLSFKAGWIVEITSLKTVNENGVEQSKFVRGHSVGVNATLKNIAMTEKVAVLTITMYDSLNISINSLQIDNFIVPPNETLASTTHFLIIPESAFLGQASVQVCVYRSPLSQGRIPYSPMVSKTFLIVDHDVAVVSVEPSTNATNVGDAVTISVLVENAGGAIESFSVNAYYADVLIGSLSVVDLMPSQNRTLIFSWDTSGVIPGFYVISASAPLSEDANPSDNTFMDGTVHILSQEIHDVAITNVQPSSNTATIGTVLEITVTTKNLGTTTESFNVTAYYNTSIIGTIQVQNLEPQTQKPLTFHWDTSDAQNITTGNFEISATASPVPSEENLENNHYTDGIVQIQTPTETHDIAVTNVTPQSRFVYVGDFLDVNVTVKNKGTQTESFQLTLIYDQINNITTINVDNLAAGTERNIIFHWNTTTISVGNHTISAYAKPVPLEENTGDNTLTDGQVQFAIATKGIPLPDWFPWFLLLLLLIILLTALFIYYYKRRKESKTAFHSGWTAWYYTYDPHTKPHNPTKRTSRQGARTRRTRKPTTTTQKRLTHSTRHF
jgi:hypothetical protein